MKSSEAHLSILAQQLYLVSEHIGVRLFIVLEGLQGQDLLASYHTDAQLRLGTTNIIK